MSTRNYRDVNGRLHSGKTGKFVKESHGKGESGGAKKKHHKHKDEPIHHRRHTVHGGFIVPAIGIAQALKPASRLQEGLDKTQFVKTLPGKVLHDILEVPKIFGFGDVGGAKKKHHHRKHHTVGGSRHKGVEF